MAFTAQDLAAIDTAIASGELTVRAENGRMVTMRSMAELLEARSLIAGKLAEEAVPCRPAGPRVLLADFRD